MTFTILAVRIHLTATAVVLVVAGCSSTPTTPKSDDDMVRDAARAHDPESLQDLTCPQFHAAIASPEGWMKDAAQMGEFITFERLAGPKGGEGADGNVSEWGRVEFEGAGLQVAKIDGEWLVCES